MYIRFDKGRFVNAVIPSVLEAPPSATPGDIIWNLPNDINPTKTIEEIQNIQATDPISGQLLFNTDGSPIWETESVNNDDGLSLEVVKTKVVPVTYKLMENPTIFTPDDIKEVTSYEVVS